MERLNEQHHNLTYQRGGPGWSCRSHVDLSRNLSKLGGQATAARPLRVDLSLSSNETLKSPPSPDGRLIDRLPNLGNAGGSHRSADGPLIDVAVVPLQPNGIEQIATTRFRVLDNILVVNLNHTLWMEVTEMLDQLVIDLTVPGGGSQITKWPTQVLIIARP